MAEQDAKPSGPDLSQGVAFTDLADGAHACQAMSATSRCCWRAAATSCSPSAHPAATITARSPKGCWSATPCAAPGITPASACAPARRCVRRPSAPIDCWSVEQRDGKVFVTEKREPAPAQPAPKPSGKAPDKIVIVGGGAAGFAAAEMLRRQQYKGSIVMLSNDDARAGRPAEPLQGLPRRQRAGGVGPAARRRLLCRERHRPAPQGQCRGHRSARARSGARRTAARSPTTGCCWRPAPSRCACRFPGRTAARPHAAQPRRQPRHHRAGQAARARRGDRRELHRARGRGLTARARHRGPCRGAGEAADGAHPGPGDGRLRARPARGARRRLPSRGHGGRRSTASRSR